MHRAFMGLAVPCLTGITIISAQAAEPFELKGSWWQEAAVQSRHTTLVCSFDSAENHDADYARDFALSGGFGMTSDVAGLHGSGVQIAETGGHLHFLGGSNFQAAHGTVRFAVKGDVWADETPRWLFEARGKDRIGIMRETGKLALRVSQGRRADSAIGEVVLDVGEVAPDEWHTVVASWDRDARLGWIALDGKGATGEMEFSSDYRPAFAIYLGGGFGGRAGGLNLPGLTFDDFVLYDVPLPILEAEMTPLPEEDAAYLLVVEDGVRQTMNYMADLQRWGGWQCIYTWPTLLGSAAQGREYVDFDDYIDNDKGNGSAPLAAKFLWAYETLGDYRYLDVGLRSGEFYLAAQAEEGWWSYGYRMTVHGVKPTGPPRAIKFQDQDQAHPMLLLTYLHRLTGDERYLDAVKKAAEFYLIAQNPNGSWPHHYDLEEGTGENAGGRPGGGELNDRATNDGIDIMALMYHITGEAKYVQAMKRCADWLLEAQGDAVPLWSDQYDADNNPVWARAFEPPAYGVTATLLACQALRETYRFSGDERYLEGIRRTDEWVKANLPDGTMSTFVDVETGRPIAAWERKIYFLDEPESVAFLKTVPIGSGYAKTRSIGPSVSRFLEQAPSKPKPEVRTAAAALAALPDLRGQAQHAMDSRNEAGVWTVPNVADFMGSLGEGFGSSIPRASMMIAYVEAARIAMGGLEPRYPGSHNMRQLAYPYPDWYEVDWEANVQ